MTARLPRWHGIAATLFMGWAAASAHPMQDNTDAEFVKHALATELTAVQDAQHPMRYKLRKSSPRLSTTKHIVETKDGAVARLVAVNDKALSAIDEQKEQARLDALLSDPSKQHHRKQAEDDDTSRVLKVIRALPVAFLYDHLRTSDGPHGKIEKFAFKPNPGFEPPDIETHALTEMTGELWVDAAENRVTRLEGHLDEDVDFGWGLLGRLNKGGWIVIEQANVADHQWRIVHFQLVMSGRILFKNKSFDTQEDQTDFVSVPAGINYSQAIRMLRSEPGGAKAAR
jgi:hypothetical protein